MPSSNTSEEMKFFFMAVQNGDVRQAQRMIKFNPKLALEHSGNELGNYTTALQAAMGSGDVALVDQILQGGARMDLPIGAPPKARWYGETAMTLAASQHFKNVYPNSEEILKCMVRHYSERAAAMQATEKQARPLLDHLRDTVASHFEKIKIMFNDMTGRDIFPVDPMFREKQENAYYLFEQEAHEERVIMASQQAVRNLLDPNDTEQADVLNVMGPQP